MLSPQSAPLCALTGLIDCPSGQNSFRSLSLVAASEACLGVGAVPVNEKVTTARTAAAPTEINTPLEVSGPAMTKTLI